MRAFVMREIGRVGLIGKPVPLSTGFVGAEKGIIAIGETVAVIAQGPVGLMATAGARLQAQITTAASSRRNHLRGGRCKQMSSNNAKTVVK